MKSAGKARNNGLYRHIRTSKEIIRNLLNDYINYFNQNMEEMRYSIHRDFTHNKRQESDYGNSIQWG